jgi:hypothetical protein
LKEIVLKEYDETGTAKQLNSTTIEWGDKSSSIEQKAITGLPSGKILTGDFNGDGFTDVLIYNTVSEGKGWKMYLYDTAINGYPQTPSINNSTMEFVPSIFYARDINGDGKDELIIGESCLQFYTLNNNNSSITNIGSHVVNNKLYGIYFGDFDGNGSTDIAFLIRESEFDSDAERYDITWILEFKSFGIAESIESIVIWYYYYYDPMGDGDPLKNNPPKINVLDCNGNSKVDLMVKTGGSTKIYEFNGSNFVSIHSYGAQAPFDSSNLFSGDINGDGIADIIACYPDDPDYATYYTWKLFLAKGNGTFEPGNVLNILNTSANSSGTKPLYPIVLADMNGNGKNDVIQGVYSNGVTTFTVLLSKGYVNGEYLYDTKTIAVSGKYILLENCHVGDYNGNGRLGILLKDTATSNDSPKIIYFIQDNNYEFITQIEDGIGKKI